MSSHCRTPLSDRSLSLSQPEWLFDIHRGSIRLTVKRRRTDSAIVQRRVCRSFALLPSEPMTGTVATFARCAAVFLGFLNSRFDLFCPFAMDISNDAGAIFVSPMTEARRDRGCELICKARMATVGGDAALAIGSETTQPASQPLVRGAMRVPAIRYI
jgi:hypothetical protein